MKKNTTLVLLFLVSAMHNICISQTTELVWAHKVGDYSNDEFAGSTVDQNSNILSIGEYANTVDFDPGATTFELNNDGRVFIQKLDLDANFIWAKSINPSSISPSIVYNVEARDIATDLSNNVISLGRFGGETDFDPNEGEYLMTPIGYNDTFILKMDEDGNFLWATHFGGTNLNKPVAVSTDNAGNIYVTGTYQGVIDFDPDPDIDNILDASEMGSVSAATYLMKFSPDGDLIWAHSIPTDGKGGLPNDVKADEEGNVLLTGYFTGLTDFDLVDDVEQHSGSHDAYLVKYDTDANFLWLQVLSSSSFNKGIAIAIGNNGNIYSTGEYGSTVDFDPGPDDFSLSAGGMDIYVQKLSSDGSFLWAKTIGSNAVFHTPFDISVEKSGDYNVFLTGSFGQTVDFDPGLGVFEMTATGEDVFWEKNTFVEKLSPDGDFEWALPIANSNDLIAASIVSLADGGVFISGKFLGSPDFDPTDDLFELSPAGAEDAFMAKYTYCIDETFTLSANVLPTINAECTVETLPVPTAYNGCGVYYQGSPDISLPITEEGDYTILWTYENNDGLTLTQSQDMTVVFLDSEILNMGDHLSSSASSPDYSYQWVDCDNGNAEIPGATSQDFYPGTSGYFALKISTSEGCFYNSPCQHYFAVDLAENQFSSNIDLYPNPTSGRIFINFNAKYESLKLRIVDILGNEVKQLELNNANQTELFIDTAKGWYFIEMENELGEIARTKILKK